MVCIYIGLIQVTCSAIFICEYKELEQYSAALTLHKPVGSGVECGYILKYCYCTFFRNNLHSAVCWFGGFI